MDKKKQDEYAANLQQFFLQHVDKVLKQPAGCLKYPFIDPGSVYDGNLWDWDSFWAAYSLFNLAIGTENAELLERISLHAKGNVLNFLDLQLEDGYIPMMVETNRNQEPYLLKKHLDGEVLNMHKPFLCQQICLISGCNGSFDWISGYTEGLERYFACYDRHYLKEPSNLYVWADDVMIGMDNDPATFGRPRFSTANIFLNSFMVRELLSMARILDNCGQAERAALYDRKAVKLVEAIQAECWDARDSFFYSVDVDVKTRSYDWFHVGLGVFWHSLPIKIRAFSGFLPLWAGFTSQEQAQKLVRHILDTNTFKSEFGIRSLSRDEKMYNLTATNNPSNWLGPIWLIVNYVVFRGLLRYGYLEEAKEICENTVFLLGRDLEETGTLHEFYSPETGLPIMNGGFINWNMLVLNMIDELHGMPSMDRFLGSMNKFPLMLDCEWIPLPLPRIGRKPHRYHSTVPKGI